MDAPLTYKLNWFYVSYWVRYSEAHIVAKYCKLKAYNKRHARKVLFKFIPKEHRGKFFKLKISSCMFTPGINDFYDYCDTIRFWDMSQELGKTIDLPA